VFKSFHCTVVTPEGTALEEQATSAVFPAYDGEYGVLPNHAPLLSLVGAGLLKVTTVAGARRELYVDGGFAQVTGDRLTLATENARPLEELTAAGAAALLAEARHMPGTTDAEIEARDAAYDRARAQARLVRRQGGAG
jgi:F-type H+-transporting ATPase subunit epsilon